MFSEWHSCLGLFLNICRASNYLELNGLRFQTACLVEFHRGILSEAIFQ